MGQRRFTLLPLEWEQWEGQNDRFDKRFARVFLARANPLLEVTVGASPEPGSYSVRCFVKTIGTGEDEGESLLVQVRMEVRDGRGEVVDDVSTQTSVRGVRPTLVDQRPTIAHADQGALARVLADHLLFRTHAGWNQ